MLLPWKPLCLVLGCSGLLGWDPFFIEIAGSSPGLSPTGLGRGRDVEKPLARGLCGGDMSLQPRLTFATAL